MGFSSWREPQNPHFWNPPSTSFEDMYITHHTNFFCKWKQNILEALTPCSSFHFLDLRFRFTFDFARLSPFTVVHWLLCAWFTFTFQLYHRSFKVYIHFSIKFTFPLLLNSLSLFQLDLLRWEGRRTQVDLHGQLLVSSSISCPQTQIQFQLEIFRSWDKLIFLSKLYQKHKRRRLIYDFRH